MDNSITIKESDMDNVYEVVKDTTLHMSPLYIDGMSVSEGFSDIKSITSDIKDIRQNIAEIKEKLEFLILHFKYMPDGPGAKLAKESFESAAKIEE